MSLKTSVSLSHKLPLPSLVHSLHQILNTYGASILQTPEQSSEGIDKLPLILELPLDISRTQHLKEQTLTTLFNGRRKENGWSAKECLV